MTTTFSPLWRIAILQPGDAGTDNSWGTIQSTSVPLPEQGAVGQTSVSIAGLTTYTLTTANNASDQARYLAVNYTGALTGACTVTMPNVNRVGWAQNSTTGSENVILTSGGGTTATIPPNGSWYFWWCDGSGNVSLPGVGFGSIQLPGTLDVAALDVSGLLEAGTIEVSGSLTVGGGETIIGGSTIDTLTVSGTAAIGASGTQVTVSGGNLLAAGSISAAGAISGLSETIGVTGTNVIVNAGMVTATGPISGAAATAAAQAPQWQQVVAGGGSAAYNNVAGSRVLGTTYTNSQGRPIVVSVSGSQTGTGHLIATVSGTAVATSVTQSSGNNLGLNFIVPAGATYSVNVSNGGLSGMTWYELY